LRQGDSLSPFLFILGFEILSKILLREENLSSLHGIKIARMNPPISHLLFADDVMIFSQANVVEANVILYCLLLISSGQGNVLIKPSLPFSSVRIVCLLLRVLLINCVLKLPHIPARAKYLEIPRFILRKKNGSFSKLKDRTFAKVTSWKAMLLSQATKTTLIRSVLNAILVPFCTVHIHGTCHNMVQNASKNL
jgi:hypothetical protein